jgi:two-component system, chemotaxis family, protein-glutamate methylesterase/glutaminase
VHKPTALATDQLYELSAEVVHKVKIAARARAVHPIDPSRAPSAPGNATPVVWRAGHGARIVVVAIVLHIPVGYTAALAARMNESSAIRVMEAYDGLPLTRAMVVLARAGVHMKVISLGDSARVVLDPSPIRAPHRPSVDALFVSAARAYGPRVLGVVLTGMGDDGLEGARAIREAGGSVIKEAESSCVVYGMPRTLSEAGLSLASVPLEGVALAIVRAL